MLRENIGDLIALVAVAEERSFTKAAGRLGVSQSALSHTIKTLETRLGVRLLTRTTRSVAPTHAGEQLLRTLAPSLRQIEHELVALTEHRDVPAGIVRINATEYAIDSLLWPKLAPVLRDYPDIRIELVADNGYANLAADQFDAGVRYGDQVSEGMIAQRIGPDERMICVAAPSYFAAAGRPRVPQDATAHRCVNLRLPTHGNLYAWEFEENGREIRVKVQGQLCFNSINHVVRGALDGYGLALLPERLARPFLDDGRLEICLDEFSPYFAGHHIYYPSRRQASAAFRLVLDALRHRA